MKYTYINRVTVEDPDNIPEIVPPGVGTCYPGYNPINGERAVASTNNTDCVEIAQCSSDSECSNGEQCIGGDCVQNSSCNTFTTTPLRSTTAPLTTNYSCVGNGTNYSINVTDEYGNIIVGDTSPNGSFTLSQTGIYQATCSVDNDTGLRCGDHTAPLNASQVTTLAEDYGQTIAPLVNGSCNINRWTFSDFIDHTQYIDTSSSSLAIQVSSDAFTYAFLRSMTHGCALEAFAPPSASLIQVLEQQAILLLDNACIEYCSLPITVGSTPTTCNSLTTEDATTISAARHSIDVICIPDSEFAQQEVIIDCGNGIITTGVAQFMQDGIIGLPATCTYVRGGSTTRFTPTCSVAGISSPSCSLQVTLQGNGGDTGTIGSNICGNAIVEKNEECDDGNRDDTDNCLSTCRLPTSPRDGNGNNPIGGGNDTTTNPGGGPGNQGGGTSTLDTSNGNSNKKDTCTVDTSDTNALIYPISCPHTAPACAWIDPPSIHVGEYLPFRWDVELNPDIDMNASTCSQITNGQHIPGTTMECVFSLYNGNGIEQQFTKNCIENNWTYPLFNDTTLQQQSQEALGKSFIQLINATNPESGNALSIDIGQTLGEYQLSLDEIRYTYCVDTSDIGEQRSFTASNNSRICAMNFAVTDSFIMDKGNTFSTAVNTSLDTFTSVDGTPILDEETLEKLQPLQITSYSAKDITTITKQLTDTYLPLAVSTTQFPGRIKQNHASISNISIDKIPNQEMYIYQGKEDIIISEIYTTDIPFTLIATQANIRIAGSLGGKGMYIAHTGNIIFENINCDLTDTISGIFIAAQGFSTARIRNDLLDQETWCDNGRLIIQGNLIGQDFDPLSLGTQRRSTLYNWFNIDTDTQQEKIFDAASLLLESNPHLRKQTPPGLDIIQKHIYIQK